MGRPSWAAAGLQAGSDPAGILGILVGIVALFGGANLAAPSSTLAPCRAAAFLDLAAPCELAPASPLSGVERYLR